MVVRHLAESLVAVESWFGQPHMDPEHCTCLPKGNLNQQTRQQAVEYMEMQQNWVWATQGTDHN